MSSRSSWRSNELAERLTITERSVRRDITRLRELGYPIESVTGPYGGYSLGAGGRLPPLLLDDDEAVSIAVALHDLAHRSAPGIADAAVSALTKLGQVMPHSLRERVGALSAVVVGVQRPRHPDDDDDDRREPNPGQVDTLMAMALMCSRGERTRFDYRSGGGEQSARHTEPYRLVSANQRWYLVAFDLDRQDWRTFRVDRIERVRPTGARFVHGAAPDAAELVAAGIAVNAYAYAATVAFEASLDVVAAEIPPTVGVAIVDPGDPKRTLVTIGGDPDWIARFLAGHHRPFTLIDADAVADELRAIGERLVRGNVAVADAGR